MYMLFAFGREVERFIGRRAFLVLYALLLLIPSVFLLFWGAWQRVGLAGSSAIHFGIFIAFATIYPNVELFLRIMAKWVALIFVGGYSLQFDRLPRLVGPRSALAECGNCLGFYLLAQRRIGARTGSLVGRRAGVHAAPCTWSHRQAHGALPIRKTFTTRSIRCSKKFPAPGSAA